VAGDWLKIELNTPDKPEVIAIASRLGLDPDAVVGKLIRVWRWFNEHTKDGNAIGVTYAFLDRICGVTGFAEQMALVGWLQENGHTLSIPNFDYHNGDSAKKRAETQKRVAKHRDSEKQKSNADVTQNTLPKALPEKRREEKNKTIAPVGFEAFWNLYPKRKSRGAAEKAWIKLKPDEQLQAQIFEGVRRAKTSADWLKDRGQFIPHPSTWLNDKGWLDDGPAESKSELFAGAI